MADDFLAQDSATSPARRAWNITPSDAVAIDPLPKALLIGASGTLIFRAAGSAADVSLSVVAGQILPIRILHVRATGTSAGNIVALA